MNRYIAETVGIFTSYSMSALTLLNEINIIGAITALAGASLTIMLAYKQYKIAKGIELDNEIKRQKLINNE